MLKNTRLKCNLTKMFPTGLRVVLGTAAILGGMELIPSLSNYHPVPDSTVLFGSTAVNAASDVAAMEKSVHEQINQYRSSRGLPKLELDSRISAIARQHSKEMSDNQVPFGHSGSSSRYKAISKLIPWKGVAENVAYNMGHSNPGEVAVDGWKKSPGHNRNMLGKYEVTGIGIAKNSRGEYYFTQLFVYKR